MEHKFKVGDIVVHPDAPWYRYKVCYIGRNTGRLELIGGSSLIKDQNPNDYVLYDPSVSYSEKLARLSR